MRNSHVLLLGEGPGPEPTLPVSFPDVAELNLLDLLNVDAETLQELARAGRVLSLSTSYFHLSAPGNFWGATAAMGNQNAHFLEDLLFPQFSLLQVRVGDATRTAILPTNSALGGGAPQSRLSLLTIPLGHMQSALTAHRLLRVQFLPRALHSHPIGLAVLQYRQSAQQRRGLHLGCGLWGCGGILCGIQRPGKLCDGPPAERADLGVVSVSARPTPSGGA